jgi:predicted nucleic acid-binding protein
VLFLDTSVVVAYYLPETYSDQAQACYLSNPQLAISSFVAVETLSVISRLVRTRSLPRETAEETAKLFNKHWDSGFYIRLDLGSLHFQLARQWIGRFDLPLKGPDALHLAVASIEKMTLATADRQLARNAQALDIAVDLLKIAP